MREIERESVCEREREVQDSHSYIYRILTHFTDFALEFFSFCFDIENGENGENGEKAIELSAKRKEEKKGLEKDGK